MLTREQKRDQYEQLREVLKDVSTLFLLDNNGLTVNQVNEIRAKVRSINATYRVVKNSVVKLAVEGTELEGLAPHLAGPKVLAFTDGDGVELAKVLKEFLKGHPALTLEHGYLEGQILEAKEAAHVAELPSREDLLTKLAFILQSPIRRLAVALNTPVQNLASVVSQVAENKEE
ncbi:MAG: 50S ribosomal protein L10 [bacterium]|nr:50S ribosomal protein L10 [bacterium]